MTAVLLTILNFFVVLAGPYGTAIYVAPSQIVAVIGSPGVGAHAHYNEPARVCL